ncbi:MAG: hypothetical protein HFH36_07610 [Lachnospiraceae bacterium]|nr:hypothetical protein [Lachnospiraceae bacterium]
MFYELDLDDKSYQEIEADAIFQIAGKYPDWTNYNQSDPGIMLLGLLAWLKEIQQYHISRLGGWKRQKFLKLLGVSVGHLTPARGTVSVEWPAGASTGRFPLRKGSRFFAGDMAFETLRRERIHPIKLIGAYIMCGNSLERYVNIGNDLEKHMHLYPFGEQPKAGNRCCFVMDRAFAPEGQTVMSFGIRTEYEVTRNPISEDFIPLARLTWEYQSAEGWEQLPVDFDTTHAFLQSGRIGFHLPKEMVEDAEYGAYQIRVTLDENDYDVAPLIESVYFNEIEVRQQYSYCDFEDFSLPAAGEMLRVKSGMYLAKYGEAELYIEKDGAFFTITESGREEAPDGDMVFSFSRPGWAAGMAVSCRLAAYEKDFWERRKLGVGNGFANQEYRLETADIVYDEFEIMVRDRQDGGFYPYRRVEDFDECTPEDAVYMLELSEGSLLFGNCENGMAPDGEIRLLRVRSSSGKSGNIKSGKIQGSQEFPGLLVKQNGIAYGGKDDESLEECYERLCLELKKVHRGVTYEDYEALVKQTPGLLVLGCKAVPPVETAGRQEPPENEISIVVQPLSYRQRDGHLSDKYRQNLEQMLRKRKIIGTSVKILNPEYIGISVFAEIVIRPHFTDAEERIEKAVRAYLDEKSWEIGRLVSASAIYGIIDILPCVWQARSLTVEAAGRGVRHMVNGDVQLPNNGLPYLKDLDLRIFTERGAENV